MYRNWAKKWWHTKYVTVACPSTVEEEREQLQLGRYHSTIDNQDSNMQQSAVSQNPLETDQPKDTETNAVQGLLSLSGMQKPRTCWLFI